MKESERIAREAYDWSRPRLNKWCQKNGYGHIPTSPIEGLSPHQRQGWFFIGEFIVARLKSRKDHATATNTRSRKAAKSSKKRTASRRA